MESGRNPRTPEGATPYLPAALIAAAALALYLLTLSRHYSPDTMAFAVLTSDTATPSKALVPAEHVGYPSLGWAWYGLWRLLGYEGGPLPALQTLNAIAGAMGVGTMYLLARRILGGRGCAGLLALAAAIALGGSYAYWYHSTEGEDQTLANTLLLAACYTLLAGGRAASSRRSLLVGGATLGAAVLAHATHVLFVPAALMLAGGRGLRERVACFGGSLAAVLLTGYLVAAAIAGRLTSPGALWDWLWGARFSGVWGRPVPSNVWQGSKTLAGSVIYTAGGPSLRALARGEIEVGNVLALLWLLFVLGGAGVAILYSLGPARRERVVLGTAVWAVVYGLFNLYWAPEDIQFWVAVLPPLLLLTTLALAALPRVAHLTAAGLAIALLLTNLGLRQWERHQLESNSGYWQALCVSQNTQPQDLVLAPGWGWAGNYLRYFGEREVLSLLDAYLVDAGRDKAALLKLAEERMQQTQARGGRVYLARLFDLPQEEERWLRERTSLSPADFPWTRRQAFECGGETVWHLPAPS